MNGLSVRTWWCTWLAAGLWLIAVPDAEAQVGMTQKEFEAISGQSIQKMAASDGQTAYVYRDTWVAQKTGRQLSGRTIVEFDANQKVRKESFEFDKPLPNTATGATDAVGIAFNLMPASLPTQFVDCGKTKIPAGWLLWFDYGEGRRIGFALDESESQIRSVSGEIHLIRL